MWLMTDRGFYSVVEHRDDRELLLVRARVRADLGRLRPLIPRLRIEASPDADYPYRAVVRREEWAVALVQMTQQVAYTNFKGMVQRRFGWRRHDIYMMVWSALHGLEHWRARQNRTPLAHWTAKDDDALGRWMEASR